MSLWDTDKNGDSRGNPSLNANDGILQRLANATTSIHPVTDASTTTGHLKTANAQIIANDGTYDIIKLGLLSTGKYGLVFNNGSNNKMYLGQDASNNYVFKVAKDGFDADTTGNANLIFNSSQNMFKIVATGTATIPTSGTNTASVSVAHGLSFIPAFTAFVLVSGNYNTVPLVNINATTGAIISLYSGWSDATNINFNVIVPGGTVPSTTPVKYYLFQETAN